MCSSSGLPLLRRFAIRFTGPAFSGAPASFPALMVTKAVVDLADEGPRGQSPDKIAVAKFPVSPSY
ncbi:Uu.00g077290.m01.CDS01 [Anthostomella pinea]|uniref:Uu.00g077290.m01.CDS01 n=1 Tax=Anthostomella pinea TaxID=933095 RepID=A0AAI8VWQ8_9PEZI|nr:Uu.00g077290.m01.CDS01 [Anthostomella pinea]